MNWLERLIKQRYDDTAEMMLQGAAADYTAYATLVGRLNVLKSLLNDIKDRHDAEAAGEDLKDDDA